MARPRRIRHEPTPIAWGVSVWQEPVPHHNIYAIARAANFVNADADADADDTDNADVDNADTDNVDTDNAEVDNADIDSAIASAIRDALNDESIIDTRRNVDTSRVSRPADQPRSESSTLQKYIDIIPEMLNPDCEVSRLWITTMLLQSVYKGCVCAIGDSQGIRDYFRHVTGAIVYHTDLSRDTNTMIRDVFGRFDNTYESMVSTRNNMDNVAAFTCVHADADQCLIFLSLLKAGGNAVIQVEPRHVDLIRLLSGWFRTADIVVVGGVCSLVLQNCVSAIRFEQVSSLVKKPATHRLINTDTHAYADQVHRAMSAESNWEKIANFMISKLPRRDPLD
jgi:hypothetical protein